MNIIINKNTTICLGIWLANIYMHTILGVAVEALCNNTKLVNRYLMPMRKGYSYPYAVESSLVQ